MSLKLMYITNDPDVAYIAQNAGVDRIFIDLEYIGKDIRQGGMDTVQSHHTLNDVKKISERIKKSEVLVRINPIHDKTDLYGSSSEEIDEAIKNGADVLMLPYFKTAAEAEEFARLVGGRCKTMLLVETPEAVSAIDEILNVDGIDEMYIGLNDLSLGYGKKFMFELLADGTVENLVNKFKKKGVSYGFGGLASLDGGLLPGRLVLKEHYHLGSSCVILSRSFCNANKVRNLDEISKIFKEGIAEIREYEEECKNALDFEENKKSVSSLVEGIVKNL
ncbi:MAG: aldolase [Clostridia bacterium]|nr:aldolase [Clostridia bacterium]